MKEATFNITVRSLVIIVVISIIVGMFKINNSINNQHKFNNKPVIKCIEKLNYLEYSQPTVIIKGKPAFKNKKLNNITNRPTTLFTIEYIVDNELEVMIYKSQEPQVDKELLIDLFTTDKKDYKIIE